MTQPNDRVNKTHDPNLKSWVESANDPATDFPIQNLPLAVIQAEHDGHSHAHLATVIGDQMLDISMLSMSESFTEGDENLARLLHAPFWNYFAAMPDLWPMLRRRLIHFLRADTHAGQQTRRLRDKALTPLAEAPLTEPMAIGSYTDFYASIHHATTVGSMFRPDNPLLPNYKHIPIGYHGRASSIVGSGTEVHRPRGQQSPPENDPEAAPPFGPCKMLDYELEVGIVMGPGNRLGHSIPVAEASETIFGLCLVNDWSARDIQKWEYQPLGPFLAKNFATTISPFIVTTEALAPFRCPAFRRPDGDPRPLPYLFDETDQSSGAIDITLEVYLQSAEMLKRGLSPVLLSKSNAFKDLYWTPAQLVAHHTSNGCNLQPGDLLASGTVSGPGPTERGCLLELTWDGIGPDGKPKPRKPIQLPSGETRTFLADGDEVIFKGYCQRDGFRRIGFGECRGRIVAAVG